MFVYQRVTSVEFLIFNDFQFAIDLVGDVQFSTLFFGFNVSLAIIIYIYIFVVPRLKV